MNIYGWINSYQYVHLPIDFPQMLCCVKPPPVVTPPQTVSRVGDVT